jgi:hypothetical protein
MTDDRLPLAELLAKAGDGDFLCSVAEAVLQMLMEADGGSDVPASAASVRTCLEAKDKNSQAKPTVT